MAKGNSGHFTGTKGEKSFQHENVDLNQQRNKNVEYSVDELKDKPSLNNGDIIKERKVNKESDATINPNEIINKQKQERHLEQVAKSTGRRYIYGDLKTAQNLVNKFSGKGVFVKENMESVVTNKIIGIYKDNNGNSYESNVIIVTSKTDSHVYPGFPIKIDGGKKND